MVHGLPMGEAFRTYSILAVGDGLVTQLPAVIISIAAAMLLSKGGLIGSTDRALIGQLGGYPTALGTVAVLMAFFAFIPGLPLVPFLIGAVALGAAAGQVVVADSTTVLLYKLSRAAVDARPDRRKIVLDTDNFPTDRYVLEGIAAERGLTLVWIETDPAAGITPAQVAEVVDADTALVLFSHVAYRSGWLADAAEINRIAHAAGALTLWDLSHSAGSVAVKLDAWGADLAVGCTYKYLNGGPGAPAFGYLRRDLQAELRQPIQGWMGHRAAFEMGPGHEPADGIRALLSGTPPILAMVPLHANLDMLAEAGIEAVRAKSVLLTGYVLELADRWLAPLGVEVVSPREASQRGGHVTLRRPGFEQLLESLWDNGVIPDYRRPDGVRIGPAPLSTSFTEVHRGLSVLRTLLEKQP
jgi:kynureninase